MVKELQPPRMKLIIHEPDSTELAKRKRVFDEVMAIRKKTGIVIQDAAVLIRELRGNWTDPA